MIENKYSHLVIK